METFDNSMIQDFLKCPRSFQLRHIEELVPQDNTASCKAEFGSCIHDALEAWYNGNSPEEMDSIFATRWLPFDGLDNTGIRTMEKGLVVCKVYRETYPKEYFSIIDLEIGGCIDLGNFGFIFRCDGLIRNDRGEFLIFEHKTSAHRGFLTVNPNSQLTGYMVGVSEIKGLDINKAILNQIYFRKGRKGAPSEDAISLVREEAHRTPFDFEEWRSDISHIVGFIRLCEKSGYFPKNTPSCTAYGGCPYREICSTPSVEVQSSIKENLFKKQKWEPYDGAKI